MHMGDIARNPATSLQPRVDAGVRLRARTGDQVAQGDSGPRRDRSGDGHGLSFSVPGYWACRPTRRGIPLGSRPVGLVTNRMKSLRRNAMPSKHERFRIAVLDDYQNVALSLANWSVLDGRAIVTVFNDHLADPEAVVERLRPFDIVCVMRERTPMTRTIIERLPRLRLIASTATRNASIDLEAADERGIQVVHTGYASTPTIELTWALILGSARNLVVENTSLRGGGWQQSVGDDMAGRTLGVLGLGNVGGAVAQIGNAFGMKVIAWSQNLTAERAAEVGATLVTKDELFQEADVLSIHLVLSRQDARPCRRRGTGAHEADGAPSEHLARTDRGRGGSRCGA